MRIVTWNCNGALRRKFRHLDDLDADIVVVQECENPELANSLDYGSWCENYLWHGDDKNKGIGIFARVGIELQELNWSTLYEGSSVKYFLPCRVNNSFNLLAVWTHQNDSPTFGYIGQFWKYMQVNSKVFGEILVAGDFNSNVIWDKKSRWWNHSDVVRELTEMGIESLYHLQESEMHGQESKPTFFLQRKLEKPYHIDYVFASEKFRSEAWTLEVGEVKKWLEISDHLPLIADLKV